MAYYTCGMQREQKWYNRNIFPLVPVLEIRKADEHNTSNFTFRWMFLTLWTLDVPSIEVAVVADTHWGFGVIGILPYLRWVFTIPCPEKVSMRIHKNLSRGKF